MYKIINITDREGKVKEEFIEELRRAHPKMQGQFLYPLSKELIESGMMRLCFIWTDNSDKVLRTSVIQSYTSKNKNITVTTENSIYTLERVE